MIIGETFEWPLIAVAYYKTIPDGQSILDYIDCTQEIKHSKFESILEEKMEEKKNI